ncbi:MAG: glycosyltransferase family 4 protein [Caulobacteraceae bacterium]|nr:glycosyltransferase family 4 protein [Caulobacter sp.]
MPRQFALHHPPARLSLKANPFGKDVANLGLFRAIAQHGGLERLHVAGHVHAPAADVAADLELTRPLAVSVGPIADLGQVAQAGALLRGQPTITEVAWRREALAGGARGFSLMGLVHTLAPPATREQIAQSSVAPVRPWDALICTSPSVRENLEAMFDGWEAHLLRRFGGVRAERPALPVIPLGVDAARFAALADRPQVRSRLREELGVTEAEPMVLWVGRLSYFEKAFPQAMFRAVRRAAERAGVRAHFALAGWFPEAGDEALYRQAAELCAPGVRIHWIDGNDREAVGELWAAADVFLSLVDNIQETFGITPVEAKAAGLPVVASDWDGYRSTVRDGVDGFLVPTLGGAAGGLGEPLAVRHGAELDSYQTYVGVVAQHTAVDVEAAADRLARLFADGDLRRRMGAAGRAAARETFDWPRIARRYMALADELAIVRAAAPAEPPAAPRPVRGDPFAAFAGFATRALDADTVLRLRDPLSPLAMGVTTHVRLDELYAPWRLSLDETAELLSRLQAAGGAATAGELAAALAPQRRPWAMTTLAWLAKLGVLDAWGE